MVELNNSYGKAMSRMAPKANAALVRSPPASKETWPGRGSDVTKAGRCTDTGSTSNDDNCTTEAPDGSQEAVTLRGPFPALPGTERPPLLTRPAASGESDPTR